MELRVDEERTATPCTERIDTWAGITFPAEAVCAERRGVRIDFVLVIVTKGDVLAVGETRGLSLF
jgi:hypothetical protein